MEVDEVLEQLKKKFSLSDAHIEYIRPDVDAACDMDEDMAAEEVKAMEKDLVALVSVQSAASARLAEFPIRFQEYMLLAKIGSGAFGSVYKGKRKKDEKVVAVKIIDLEETKDDICAC
jgi:serine/threonine protein kinase